MKKVVLFGVLTFLVFNLYAQTYGNWSGSLYTSSKQAGSIDFSQYSPEINDWIHKSFPDKYVKIIIYVTKIGEKYTVSIKYPQNGNGYSIIFTGKNPGTSNGFSVGMQNSNNAGCYWVSRWNITNLNTSDCDRLYVVTVTDKPSQEFKLLIEYPAISDAVVDAAHPNPGCPSNTTPFYWGSIGNTVLLKGCTASSAENNKLNGLIDIYPNPVKDYINIDCVENGEFTLFDETGKIFKQGNITDKRTKISTVGLSDGIYFIKIAVNDKTVSSKIVVKK